MQTTMTRTLYFEPNELKAQTDGKGLWSSVAREVGIRRVEIEDHSVGPEKRLEQIVRVFWEGEDWNVDEDGLIYTDRGFLTSLRKKLQLATKEDWSQLGYTEQGMQGRNNVHMILGTW